MDFFTLLGVPGLALAAFLAATVLPLSSEVVLAALLLNGVSPYWLVSVATVGNVLGSVVNYALGAWAGQAIATRWLKVKSETFASARQRFEKCGLASLLFAWVPVIGDPLTLVAGVMRVRFFWFVLLVTLGKGTRYIVVTVLTLNAVG